MSEVVKQSLGVPYLIIASLITLAVSSVSYAEEDIPSGLHRCSLIDDASARLACYDAFTGRQAPAVKAAAVEPSPSPMPETRPIATPEPKQRPGKTLDDLGAETLPAAATSKAEKLQVSGTVTRCEKDARKKYLFYFDNGQVWRQVSDKRVYYRDCNFDVTVTKDFFGYKMQKDGDKGRIRISRVK